MAGFSSGEFSGNIPFSYDPSKQSDDYYDIRYNQMYGGYQTPLSEPDFTSYHYKRASNIDDSNEEDLPNSNVAIGVSIASLITENVLSHPFIVLRRQCQVHNSLRGYHVGPHTLLPVMMRLHRRQDPTTLWKGIGSTCIVKGLTIGIEDVLSKLTLWPKDVSKCDSVLSFLKHLLLKCASAALVMPFYSASLVETVASEVASDRPGFLDVFREGGSRLACWRAAKGRMLPVWALLPPTIGFALSKYLCHITIRAVVTRVLRYRNPIKQELDSSDCLQNSLSDAIQMKANFVAFVGSEILFYPMETIIHRLHIQGTRTIIDNLDTGTSVQPILTNYEGFMDCYSTTLAREGATGFYKGFGALVLQLCVHLAILKATSWVVGEVTQLFRPASPQPPKSHTSEPAYTPQSYLFN